MLLLWKERPLGKGAPSFHKEKGIHNFLLVESSLVVDSTNS